ncbi:hypothetical protein Plec18167_005047 [Paecilomyces lecythidis]|uniref:Fatty acid hydroxylase domain-containing protein n=1 Tax=Paecilomyces lecythidis TaxID=3004212 RepID=A0ABR3XKX6_9EURO
MSATRGNPKDSMKSTWRQWDKSQWGLSHKILNRINAFHVDLDREVPVHPKTDKVPHLSDLSMHLWILFHVSVPLALHQLYVYYTGSNFGSVVAYFYYYYAARIFMTRLFGRIREMGHLYGFLDGDKHERDGVPDVGVTKTLTSVLMAGFLRPLMINYVTYNPDLAPASMSWKWLPLEIGLYGIVLDFWFYWYHRIMHDVNGLWKYHRTHHLTKHPNPLLTIYADTEQELGDIVGIPLVTYATLKLMGFPMGYYEWLICNFYVQFAEAYGHSGLRLQMSPPNTFTWLMRIFDADLVIEDHDLHHRKGWRKSHNYGKQTRIWDRLFGTCTERIEGVASNIDYENTVFMQIF